MDILGVPCIVWLFNNNGQDNPSNKEKTRRKKLKDKEGSIHKDTPMLDTKAMRVCVFPGLSHQGSIVTSLLDQWDTAIRQHYCHMHCGNQIITGGHQCVFIDSDQVFVTINYYKNTKKFMVQPGNRLESNLIKWLQSHNKTICVCPSHYTGNIRCLITVHYQKIVHCLRLV
jgi:hypothetical protein